MIKVALIIIGLVCVVFFLTVVAVGALFQLHQQSLDGSGTFSQVATAARTLQEHISGSRSNQYDADDPFMQKVLDYWAATCPGKGPHGICPLAQSGNLQCVEFVTAAYWLSGDPLPSAPDAEQFWNVYANVAGWQEIPSPSADPTAPKQAPHPGDLMVFKGGAHLENGTRVEFGHIGVVVAFDAPSARQNGSIEIAEANGPGTKFPPQSQNPWVASPRPGNTYVMTVHPDYTIPTWGPYTLDGVAYSGMTALGFLHHELSAQTTSQLHDRLATGTSHQSLDTLLDLSPTKGRTSMLLGMQWLFLLSHQALLFPLADLLAGGDQTGINAAMLGIARLFIGFLEGTLAVILCIEGYQYMFSDNASRGLHLKRMIATVIGGAALVALAPDIAPQILSLFGVK